MLARAFIAVLWLTGTFLLAMAMLVAVAIKDGAIAFTGAPLPPAQYDRPYRGTLTVITVPLREMSMRCGAMRAWACAIPEGNRCTIYLPSEAKGAALERIRRHEIGHCNGWPAHHPGWRQ